VKTFRDVAVRASAMADIDEAIYFAGMTPAALIRQVRQRRGLTQAELARRAGTSQPVVSAYEHGRRDPTYETLRRLVAAGGASLELRATARPGTDVPPAADDAERGRRLLDVLSLADAIPAKPRTEVLDAPRLVSG
jgi:transcriptional regulator with XRE-family HTH domain